MFKKPIMAAAVAALVVPSFVPVAASAQSTRSRYDRDHDRGRYERTYRGKDGRYYRCKKSKGTTGTIAGAAGGALAGNLLGGGTVGTIAGGVGGALLGRHLDKNHDKAQNRKNGC